MRVSKVSLFRLRSPKPEARTEEGCFGQIVTTRLWLMVITEWWRKSQEGREDEGEGSVMDSAHHTTSSFIPSTYAICAGRYWGKSSRQKTVAENRHFWNRVMDPYWIRFPFPGRHRKYEKYLRGVPGQNDLAEGRPQEIDAL